MIHFLNYVKYLVRSGVTVILICLVFALCVAGTILIFGEIESGKRAELWIEVGKALIQLAAVVIAGTVVSKHKTNTEEVEDTRAFNQVVESAESFSQSSGARIH
jgi:hypothetical protein